MASEDLAQKKCVPCRGGILPLLPERARELAVSLPAWTLDDGAVRLSRRFVLKNFRDALAFVNAVGELAEAEGHHPDIAIHWNKVDLVLYTHKINGLHENDFIMAAKIGRMAPP